MGAYRAVKSSTAKRRSSKSSHTDVKRVVLGKLNCVCVLLPSRFASGKCLSALCKDKCTKRPGNRCAESDLSLFLSTAGVFLSFSRLLAQTRASLGSSSARRGGLLSLTTSLRRNCKAPPQEALIVLEASTRSKVSCPSPWRHGTWTTSAYRLSTWSRDWCLGRHLHYLSRTSRPRRRLRRPRLAPLARSTRAGSKNTPAVLRRFLRTARRKICSLCCQMIQAGLSFRRFPGINRCRNNGTGALNWARAAQQ